ncbi:MAG: ribonuclease D [Verrucomicrobia bacterium]|nr:ribonuclease D [Verrucomicrobiota bacterium]
MISDSHNLERLCQRIARSPFVAVDTEADSLHAYPEKLCLIQIAVDSGEELVDPLSPLNLSPLWEILKDRTPIFHGGDYDLRLLHRTAGFIPKAIWDTMIAARLLGRPEFGLVSLADQILGVRLEKSSRKANWALRPLTERMVEYALNDVRHLRALSERLQSELEAKGRSAWLEESCQRLISACTSPSEENPDEVWRVKGCHRLSRRGMSVLRSVWRWREHQAVTTNRPPFFILGHEQMVAVAAIATQPGFSPDKAPLPHRWSSLKRSGCLAAIQEGLRCPEEHWPDYPQRVATRWTDAERSRFEKIQALRDQAAHNAGLDPTLIASRATLVQLAGDWQAASQSLMRWQLELLRPAMLPPQEINGPRHRKRNPSSIPSPEPTAVSDGHPAA